MTLIILACITSAFSIVINLYAWRKSIVYTRRTMRLLTALFALFYFIAFVWLLVKGPDRAFWSAVVSQLSWLTFLTVWSVDAIIDLYVTRTAKEGVTQDGR